MSECEWKANALTSATVQQVQYDCIAPTNNTLDGSCAAATSLFLFVCQLERQRPVGQSRQADRQTDAVENCQHCQPLATQL